MKVVLFCGGQGLRIRGFADAVPKPMVPVGRQPILWHVMRYYAHYGHRDFILCLGHKAKAIEEYFLSQEASEPVLISEDAYQVELLTHDLQSWRVTFADTGLKSSVGQRLRAVRPLLSGEEVFLANYGDVVTDAPLAQHITEFLSREEVAAFLSVRPTYTFHIVEVDTDRLVRAFHDVSVSDLWINGGYLIFRQAIFDYLGDGEDLAHEPFQRLIAERKLIAYRHQGFWAPMDTLKDRQLLEQLYEQGNPPWMVWQRSESLGGGAGRPCNA